MKLLELCVDLFQPIIIKKTTQQEVASGVAVVTSRNPAIVHARFTHELSLKLCSFRVDRERDS